MKYLVVTHPSIERGNAFDSQGGPAPFIAHIMERFKPEVFYGTPTRRQLVLIVDLATEADVAELMYLFTWANGTEPSFTTLRAHEERTLSPSRCCARGEHVTQLAQPGRDQHEDILTKAAQ